MNPRDAVLSHSYSRNFFYQWVIFFALVIGAGSYYWYETHIYRPHPAAPVVDRGQRHNYFYVLRMPEMQISADVRTSRDHFGKWIDALEREGFQFFLLSDVMQHLSRGMSLPEKSAVIVFDPGYRRTADTYFPVLKEKKVPAVWLTNGKAIEAADKRYISTHVAQLMRTSGMWDLGFYTPESAIALQTRTGESLPLGQRSPWKPDAGRYALNHGLPSDAFDRLNVNVKWTEEDLVHRLLVERPVQSASILSLQQIQDRNWGMALDLDSTHDTRFTLRAAAGKRSGSLYWLGTAGLNDVHVRMDVRSLLGELRLILRSDPAIGESLSVLFSNGKVSVEEERHFKIVRLASSPCPDLKPGTPFNVVLAVMGRQLALAVNSHPLIALENLSEPTSSKGMIRLVVQDSLKGVGEARSVRIVCTPLEKK